MKTSTFVHKLTDPIAGTTIVLKAYRLRGGGGGGPEGAGGMPCWDVEIAYLRYFAEFVREHVTPHVCLPIGRALLTDAEARALLGELAHRVLVGGTVAEQQLVAGTDRTERNHRQVHPASVQHSDCVHVGGARGGGRRCRRGLLRRRRLLWTSMAVVS